MRRPISASWQQRWRVQPSRAQQPPHQQRTARRSLCWCQSSAWRVRQRSTWHRTCAHSLCRCAMAPLVSLRSSVLQRDECSTGIINTHPTAGNMCAT